MSPNASHRVRPGLSSAASLITTLLISFDQEVLNQHLNLVTPEYPFFESPCALSWADYAPLPDPPRRTTSQKLQPIPNLDRSAITVSGLSSGGFMAHQFHIAFSKLVTGAGIIAGGPFRCVETISNPYFWFRSVPLDRVSAATLACSHYYADRYW